jgi:DNA-binding MarR family transcriptional regulator
VALPRALDSDLVHATGLALHEYAVLMNLSEAPHQELRMTDLAAATALSASRITRLVDDLRSRGLVSKRRYTGDARGNVASLTPQGLARLEAAWPEHLRSARRRVVDHFEPASLELAAQALQKIAAGLES